MRLKRLALPLFIAQLHLFSSGHAQSVSDGPYLFHKSTGEVEAIWVTNGERETRTFAKGTPIELAQFENLIGKSLKLAPHQPSAGVHPAPDKFLAITDVEGEFAPLFRFLVANGVIDESGHWTFGTGHLVTIGDFVDRGDEVTEVLWLMYRLSREAELAGGFVHFLLGNHEAMILGGDTRYVADKYDAVCKVLDIPYEALFGTNTELGKWLRTRNSVVALGDVVFVHAGISPQLPIKRDTIDVINRQIRSGLGIRKAELRKQDKRSADLIWGRSGPLWYRGYFARAGFGPRPVPKEIDLLLEGLQARMIVIGHTQVDRPCFLYPPTKVLALDVSWTKPDSVRGLRAVANVMTLVDIEGQLHDLVRQPQIGSY